MIFNGKTVLIYGYGKSGKSAAKLLNKRGAIVKVYDDDYSKKDFLIFEQWAESFKDVDCVIISPAISNLKPEILELRLSGVPVISEIELGYECCFGEVVAITGTNGKTTTTMLTNAILKNGGYKSCQVGNIGTPFCDVADTLRPSDVAVVEVSSFQLEGVKNFSPEISVLLNIEPDHLDRHKTFETYASLKARIFLNQREGDFCLANISDPTIKALTEKCGCTLVPFSIEEKCDGTYLENGFVTYKGKRLFSTDGLYFKGRERENLLAAVTVAKIKNVPDEKIYEAVKNFTKPPHRLELVAQSDTKRVYDDSKATNVSATVSACEGFEDDTVLILGGSDKGEEYIDLFRHIPKTIKRVVVCGENSKRIYDAAVSIGYKNISVCDSLEKCVDEALSGKEKNVLFSPASKSYDRYHSYVERGEHFKSIVEKLI